MRHILLLVSFLCASVALFAENVNLNFFVGNTRIHTEQVTTGNTYTLSSYVSDASMSEYECRDYTFAGWKAGAPTRADETPSLVTSVTPQANVNLYAVFRKANVNRFIRITSLSRLEVDADYLIVCFYMYGGETQYYAMSNEAGIYNNDSQDYFNVGAERLYPNNGVISAPSKDLVWTLHAGAAPNTWTWYNAAGQADSKELLIRNNALHAMLVSEGNGSSCTISVSDGDFTIQDGDTILKYVDDEVTETDDYFVTGHYTQTNDYPIHLYKKESAYTSYPDCTPRTVYLNAMDGTIPGKTAPANIHLDTLVQTSSLEGLELPEPVAPTGGASCNDWTFAGWSVDAPIEGTTDDITLYPAYDPSNPATKYDPLYDGVTLYAVYKKDVSKTFYEKITNISLDEIHDGETYVFVHPTLLNGSFAVTHLGTNDYWGATRVTAEDNILTTNVTPQMEWTYVERTPADSCYFYSGTDLGMTSRLADHEAFAWHYYQLFIPDLTSQFSLHFSAGDSKWLYWVWTLLRGYHFDEGTIYIEAYIDVYRKVVRTTSTYSSYPHCTPYTVYFEPCGGTMEGTTYATEASAGSGVYMPSATPACEGWEFYGWLEGEEQLSTMDVQSADFHLPGSEYHPISDGIKLYAVYKHGSDKFRRVENDASTLSAGDHYLVTYNATSTANYYELTSEVVSTNYLEGASKEAYQDAEGYYITETNTAAMWTLGGSNNSWTFTNVGNNQKLKSDYYYTIVLVRHYYDYIKTNGTASTYTISGTGNFSIQDNTSSKYITYSGEYFKVNSSNSNCYLFRQVAEYASWPHCEQFTVIFEACGGTMAEEDESIEEAAVYSGITLPQAYANTDCAKEGWDFVGWSLAPVESEIEYLTFNLYPSGTIYHPFTASDTLYAVYQVKSNQFEQMSTMGHIYTGVNYIIANASGKALWNLPNDAGNPTTILTKTVTPVAGIITNDNDSIEWRLQGEDGEYELYNVSREVYLDLREQKARLPHAGDVALQDNFLITYDETNKYAVRSNRSLVANDGSKYLNCASTEYNTSTSASASPLYLYRQQAIYHSYPSCIEEMEALKWITNASGNYVVVESYHLAGEPNMREGMIGDAVLQSDGTYRIKYSSSVKSACSVDTVEWDGTRTALRIPYVVTTNTNSSALFDGGDCSTCDVYIMPGNTLTINADKTLHTLTVPDSAALVIANGVTLTVNSLVLFSESDTVAPSVNLNSTGSIVLKNDELYRDLRIDEERYYWMTLPFNAQLKEVSYANVAANGAMPIYRGTKDTTRFFLKYYDGVARAYDSGAYGGDNTYWTHVAAAGADYTIHAGQGYNVGIGNQKTVTQKDGLRHTKRVLRFTMRPDKTTWLAQERTGGETKATSIAPSTATHPIDAGWNLIGNPYLHAYCTGEITGSSNLHNGAWRKTLNAYGDWTGGWEADTEAEDVPYLTLYDASKPKGDRYSQVLASSYTLRPFEAVFIQAVSGATINFTNPAGVAAMPASMRRKQAEKPLFTGIILSGNNRADRTGIVLAENFTPAYEIGGDLAKMCNDGGINLYTINNENQLLAFNALSDEDAKMPIPVGVSFPEAGEYTFAFDAEQYNVGEMDSVLLNDKETGLSTNLLLRNYTFDAEMGTVNNRFELLVVRAKAPQIVTYLDSTNDNQSVRKIIRDGQLFIICEGKVYNAVGAEVR